MKTIRHTLSVLAGLMLANGLFAGGATFNHKHPWFSKVTTTYELNDGTTVTWLVEDNKDPATRKDYDTLVYTATITPKTPGSFAYSMLTLGLQAVGHDLYVMSSETTLVNNTKESAKFAKPGDTTASAPAQYPLFVPRTGVKIDPKNPKLKPVNPDNVWFIEFNGSSCKLTIITANRERIGLTRWFDGSYGEGHDTTPPPSDPN
jgi:hypothetical protein